MENFFSRYKNPLVLMLILFIQVVALATQVKRAETGGRGASSSGGTRLIRVWTVTAITPVERVLVSTGHFFRRNWHNYIDLHDTRKQNEQLQDEVARLKLEQVRLREDAQQAQRLQALLGFRERYIGQTMAAQVIGASGSEQSRVLYLDKGSRDGVRIDMAVITPDGVVGKIKDVFPVSSQVILINDRDGGAGVILQNSRLQGVLSGTPQGELRIKYIMADENVAVGEPVVTSGGDRIFPKGMPVGTVSEVNPDREGDPFLSIKVKPASNLSQLEEVLIITKQTEQAPQLTAGSNTVRAADILAERLPTVKPTPSPTPAKTPGAAVPPGANPAGSPRPSPAAGAATTTAGTTTVKPPIPSASPRTSPAAAAPTGSGTAATSASPRPSPALGTASPRPPAAATGSPRPSPAAGTTSTPGTGAVRTASPAGPPRPSPSPGTAGASTTGVTKLPATTTPGTGPQLPKPTASPKAAGQPGATGTATPGQSTTNPTAQKKTVPSATPGASPAGTPRNPGSTPTTGQAATNPTAQKKTAPSATPGASPTGTLRNPAASSTPGAGASPTATPRRPQPRPSASPTPATTGTPSTGAAERPPQ